MRDTYGAKREESMRLRFHAQTAGVSLTAQQPLNNVVRTSLEALAAVLGGTQSLHTNSFDEALALPTEEAVRVALRTQQIIAFESGAPNTPDPLGGSWFVEKLTDEMEAAAYDYFARIDELGGMVEAIRRQLPPARDRRRRLHLPARARRAQADRRRRQRLRPGGRRRDRRSCASTRRSNASRSTACRRPAPAATRGAVESTLAELKRAAATEENLMPAIIDAARARATEGEMIAAMQEVFGTYTESPVF